MISRISVTGTSAMSSGVSARSKSVGVTLFTRSSVHWALKSTATSRV